MGNTNRGRSVRIASGKILRTTPAYETYWRFAAARQDVFVRRTQGLAPPWTEDEIIAAHRFTNAYRAADRVSQYLIRHVLYDGPQSPDELFFRCLLFKLFNKIETWETLVTRLGELPSRKNFKQEHYAKILDAEMKRGERVYSAAYIMPSPNFGSPRKHRNHLALLEHMLRDGAQDRIQRAASLGAVFRLLRDYPSLGDFLAFQFTIDLNYSTLINFSEMDFVVAGPGARSGIRKCFAETSGASDEEIIGHMAEAADDEFRRLGLHFQKLGGTRPLQLIDCQNLFCETDKYARVAHPDIAGTTKRTKIKQKFSANGAPLPQFYPPKWGLPERAAVSPRPRRATVAQLPLHISPAE